MGEGWLAINRLAVKMSEGHLSDMAQSHKHAAEWKEHPLTLPWTSLPIAGAWLARRPAPWSHRRQASFSGSESPGIRVPHSLAKSVFSSVQFSRSVVSDSATPWTAARQASLSITNSQSLPKLISIESVMPPNHLGGVYWVNGINSESPQRPKDRDTTDPFSWCVLRSWTNDMRRWGQCSRWVTWVPGKREKFQKWRCLQWEGVCDSKTRE